MSEPLTILPPNNENLSVLKETEFTEILSEEISDKSPTKSKNDDCKDDSVGDKEKQENHRWRDTLTRIFRKKSQDAEVIDETTSPTLNTSAKSNSLGKAFRNTTKEFKKALKRGKTLPQGQKLNIQNDEQRNIRSIAKLLRWPFKNEQ